MKGFTIIELLIVVAISAILSAAAIVYTNVARNQTALSIQAATVTGSILHAKELAIATYNASPPGSPKVCGYGTSFNIASNTYSLFAYEPLPSKYPDIPLSGSALRSCPSIASTTAGGISGQEMAQVSPGTWNVSLSPMRGAGNVTLRSGGGTDDLAVVLFYPPDPKTLLSSDGATFLTPSETLSVHLTTLNGAASTTVSVNPAGQVNF